MKKPTVLTPEQQLIEAKYDYPATCTTYDKDGGVISRRTVTHNLKASKELIKLQPGLKKFINSYEDDEVVPAPTTVKQLLTTLGQ